MSPLGAVWFLRTIKNFKDKTKVGGGGVQPREEPGNIKMKRATKITEEMRTPSSGALEITLQRLASTSTLPVLSVDGYPTALPHRDVVRNK